MPTINKPFLLKVVLTLLVLTGSLFGAHTLQARRIPEALKQQSERAAEAGKSDAAIHYLRHYLEFEPDDIDALIQLGDMLKARNPTGRGSAELLFLYDKILRLDPYRDSIRREALSQALKLGRNSDAVTHADTLIKSFPSEAKLWEQLANAYVGLNQRPEARKAYETAITFAPDQMLLYQQLAQLVWREMKDGPGAKMILDRMVIAFPQEAMAYYYRAMFDSYRADETTRLNQAVDLTPSIRDLNRALELDPENANASLLLGEILQKNKNIPAAHMIFRDAASLYPNDLRFIRSLAWLELVRGNVAAAMAVLEDGLKHDEERERAKVSGAAMAVHDNGLKLSPEGFDLLVSLADLLVQEGDTTRSVEILQRLESRRASPLQVKYLRARIAMRQEKWSDAIELLQSLRGEAINLPGLEGQANLLLAGCHDRTGDWDASEKAFRRVLGSDPGNVNARVGLAILYLNLGRFDDAAREYEVAAQSPYAPGTVVSQWVRLSARRLRMGSGTGEQWRKLEQAAAGAVARFGPVSSESVILQADVAAAQNKYANAVQILRREIIRRPGDTRLWAALASTAADAAGVAAGLAVIDEAQAAAGDGPDVRLARAALYAREPGRVRPLDPLIERIDTWADADQLRLLTGLADIYDRAGDRVKVVAFLRKIAARRPTEVGVWLRLYERATDAGDTAAAAEARAGVVRIEGETGLSAAICDATGATTPSPQLADRLATTFGPSPNRPDACLALARLRTTAGDAADALRLTERAFNLDPTQFETTRALVTLLARTGAEERKAKLLTRLATDSRWGGEPFQRMIAGVLERVPPEIGMNLIRTCQPMVERDPAALGWVATCYTAIGKSAEAEEALLAATRAASATADDWLRLALYQASAGKQEAAIATLGTARGALQPQGFFAITATFCETPAGKNWTPTVTDPAERRLLAQCRLVLTLSRSDTAAGRAVLEAFLAGTGLRPEDTGWARRNLAMLYASGGTEEDRRRATELLRQTETQGTDLDELRATASVLAVLARYLEGADRKATLIRAASALEVVYQKSQSPRDLYTLSQLHRVAGNRAESRKCLNALMEADRKNVYYLVVALDELTENRDFAAAESFAARLRSHHAGEFRAVASVARYYAKAGKAESALTLAEQYASAADAGAGDYLARSARVAELLDELARYVNVRGTPTGGRIAEAAVARYTALVPTRPEAVVGIAGVLGSEGRVADALAKIEQFNRYLPVRLRATAGLAAVRSGGANEVQMGTVRAGLDAALVAEPDSIPLRMAEAEYFALRKQYDQAQAVYEAVIQRDPRNIVALNNLAWVLAADPATAERSLELVGRATREDGLTGELLDTRARARITLKQFPEAEQDLREALAIESTALRWFHMAVLKTAQGQKPEAAKAFREARTRGLDSRVIHPADLPTYRILEAEGSLSLK